MKLRSLARQVGRALPFLFARVAPAISTFVVLYAFGLQGRENEYLDFSVGFIVAALASGLSLGWFSHALVRTDFDASISSNELRETMWRLHVLAFLLAGVGGYLVFALLGDGPQRAAGAAAAIAVVAVQSGAGSVIVAKNQLRYQHRRLLFVESARALGGAVGAILGVVLAGSGLAALVGFGLGGMLGILPFLRDLPGGLPNALPKGTGFIRGALGYGGPVVVASLSMLTLQFSDRILLGLISTKEVAAEYATAYDLVNRPIGLVLAAVSLASQRAVFQSFEEDRAAMKDIGRRDRQFQIALGGLIGVAMFAAAMIVDPVANGLQVQGSYWVTTLAFAAAILLGLTHTEMRPIQAAKNTRRIGWLVAEAMVLNSALNLGLIPGYGPRGAGIATVMASAWLLGRLRASALRLAPQHF